MNVYGYVRVSSIDQNEDRQLIVMDKNNVPKGNVYFESSLVKILSGHSIRNSSRN